MRRRWAAGIGLMTVIFLAACGGGGGGGSSSPYTGLTTPAVIDTTNAEEIALGAYSGGDWSDPTFAVPLGRQDLTDAGKSGPSKILALMRAVKTIEGRVAGEPSGADAALVATPATVWADSGTEYGSVSGSFTYSISLNDLTGDFSGSISFSGYDDGDGITFASGSVSFSGNGVVAFDIYGYPYIDSINTFSIQFSALAAASEGEGFTLTGTIALVEGVPTSSVTLDLYVKDHSTEKTAWIRNYEITVTVGSDIGGSYAEMTIVGRIYLHDYGYVDIATGAPFRVYDTDLYPSSGVLIVTGKDDCKARLTVISDPTYDYRVELDEDGNDVYEWSIEGIWT